MKHGAGWLSRANLWFREVRCRLASLVAIVLAVLILAVLVYPFTKRRKVTEASVEPIEQVASADTLRHLLYREPVTLRNEYEAGNISIQEYEAQIGELRIEAARLMRQRAEHRTQLLEAELELEREVQRLRKLRSDGEGDEDSDGS